MKHIGIEHYGFKIVLFSAVIIHFLASMILEVRHTQLERGLIYIVSSNSTTVYRCYACHAHVMLCIRYASGAVLLNLQLSNIGAL